MLFTAMEIVCQANDVMLSRNIKKFTTLSRHLQSSLRYCLADKHLMIIAVLTPSYNYLTNSHCWDLTSLINYIF